ncbi:DUF6261 family protein [Flavobacterium sp.]|uniref:DUF6261 family protein n=1 Tax=Flavobacterium sp. TaxID=239 RepID=UPI003D0D9673
MKLIEISTTRLQNLEVGQFIIRFLTDFENQNLDVATDTDFKRLFDTLKEQSPIYDAALNQKRAKTESELLLKLDNSRDKAIRSLRRAHSVFEYTDDTTEQDAYATLKIVLKAYKDIQEENYEAESLGIDNLIVELRHAKNSSAIQLLGLERHINKLEETNNAFKNTFNQRSTNTISAEVFNTKLLRKNILETYRNLSEYVLVMAKNRNNPFYTDTLTVVNNGRKYFADLLARRHSGQEANPEENSVVK